MYVDKTKRLLQTHTTYSSSAFIKLYKGIVRDSRAADICISLLSAGHRVNKAVLIGSRSTLQNPAKTVSIGFIKNTLRFQFLFTDGSITHAACVLSPLPETGDVNWSKWHGPSVTTPRQGALGWHRFVRTNKKKKRQQKRRHERWCRAASVPLLSFSPSQTLSRWSPKPRRN